MGQSVRYYTLITLISADWEARVDWTLLGAEFEDCCHLDPAPGENNSLLSKNILTILFLNKKYHSNNYFVKFEIHGTVSSVPNLFLHEP